MNNMRVKLKVRITNINLNLQSKFLRTSKKKSH